MHLRKRSLLLLIACCTSSAFAQAQSTGASSYPTKPVRLILGPGPGSVADGLTRVMGAALSELWGQQVIVDNRPGAGNTIAPAIVAKSPPDGYALHRGGGRDSASVILFQTKPAPERVNQGSRAIPIKVNEDETI